ncbi:MAG: beta strand repeat-containing protein, partial [Opitutia bacterium]
VAYDYARGVVAAAQSLGNVRVGATATIAVTNATVSDAAFQDALAVGATGGNAKLAFVAPAQIAAGTSGDVGVTVLAAGSLADSLTLALTSKALAGTGLSDLGLASKSVALTGAAYDYASPVYAAALSLGNVRRGAAVTRPIANAVVTAAAYQDNLSVTAASNNANLTVGAPVSAIAAGASGTLSFTASTVGSLSANVTLGLRSVALNGTGLASLDLADGAIAVSGSVYDLATATHLTSLALGDVRVGATRSLAVTNTVLAGGNAAFQDSLDVAASTTSTALATGAAINVAAGATGQLTLTSLVAGALSADVALTRGSNANGLAGLSNSSLGGATVAVTGAAYDLASPTYVNTNALGNLRVGVTTKTLAVSNALITDAAYQDKLAVVATGATGLTLTNPADIAAGASGNVTLGASVAGSLTGNLSLAFTSKALAGTTLTDVALTGGSIALTGAAYDYAQAAVATSLALGNVRVGALANLGVTNTVVTSAAYQDSLDVTATTAVGTLGLTDPANILAGKTGNVVVTAAKAGSLAGDVSLALSSNANGVTGLTTSALTGATVAVTGAAYDLASPTFASTLAFGNVRRGATSTLAVANTVGVNGDAAYQDKLDLATTASNANLALTGATAAITAGTSADVVVTAAAAGSLAGSLTLGLTSNANSISGLSNVTLATGTVTVTGASYDYATATLGATALTFGDVRTGAARTASLTNTILAGGNASYQDSLDIAATTAVGTLALSAPAKLLAGQSGNVVVTAATAGSLAGSVALALTSNANGVTGLGSLALAGQSVAVTGAAYDLASPTYVNTNALGNLRVGVTTKTLAVNNALITDAAYQDKLAVVATGATGLTLTNPADIAAGAS